MGKPSGRPAAGDGATPLPTAFLPAELASPRTVARQAAKILRHGGLLSVVNAVEEGAVVLNRQRQIVFANRALLAFAGRDTMAEVVGLRPGQALRCVHAEENQGCGTTLFCRYCGAAKALRRTLANRTAAVEECRILSARNGRHQAFDLRVTSTPLVCAREEFVIFAATDISHEKQRQTLERVFFHDVLNVAGVIDGYGELIREVTGRGQAVDPAWAEHIHSAAGRLIGSIRAHRQLLAAERGELVPTPVPTDSRRLLAELVGQYADSSLAEGKNLVLAPDSVAVTFTTDHTLVSRVLENMVRNALEASAAGEVVTASCAQLGERVVFRVTNPAVLTEEVRLSLFTRSFSTKGEGRGLGTYSMKMLTEDYLHGTIAVASEAPPGTTFTVSYPLTWPEVPPGPAAKGE